MGLFLVGVMVLIPVVVVFRLRVWKVGPGVVVGIVVVLVGRGVEVAAGVFDSPFSVVVLCGDVVADDLSSTFWLFVSDACTGRRRGDLNGLVSVDVAFSRRRRFADILTEAIVT